VSNAFKDLYNKKFIRSLSVALNEVWSDFDQKKFTVLVFTRDWKSKELKQRMRHITCSLNACLPDKYEDALAILKPAAEQFSGIECLVFPDYVEVYGLAHYRKSITALEHFTKYSTSELAVRPFIIEYGDKMMAQMQRWAGSQNDHVRRLASEGCRPRLPWAMALPEFKNNPAPVLQVIEKLKSDESEYVRRSVANNLNDISKDHPHITLATAKRWHGQTVETDKLIKHACRTLLKAGDAKTMRLFGYKNANHISLDKCKLSKRVNMGGDPKFEFMLGSNTRRGLGKLRIDYAIDFVRANGTRNRKVFRISDVNVTGNTRQVSKKHSFRKITTRKYYPGKHGLSVIVNGTVLWEQDFSLMAYE